MKVPLQKNQSGVVLIIALIVLVAMTLAAIAMVRSVDTNNLIAGNLAFQQSATHSADSGIEAAVTWLNSQGAVASGVALEQPLSTAGYNAAGSAPGASPDPTTSPPQTWDSFWPTIASRAFPNPGATVAVDGAGNVVHYVIDRLCQNTGPKTGGASCVSSPEVTVTPANQKTIGAGLNGSSSVFYRITVRVDGPKNTVSYVQSFVAM